MLWPFRHFPDGRDQVSEVVRLEHRRLPAFFQESASFVACAVAGDEYETPGKLRPLVHELLPQCPAAESRHLEICDHRVEPGRGGTQPLDRLQSILHRHYFVPLTLQQQPHCLPVHRVVVNDKNPEFGE
jgi:hypothetical protein